MPYTRYNLALSRYFHHPQQELGHNPYCEDAMAVGLRIPVGVNPAGGAALVARDENNEKIIKTALSSCYNENAFQQGIGIGEDFVFDTNDLSIRMRVQRILLKIFEEFTIQKRFKLINKSIKWTENSADGELALEFKYYDMEADEEKSITQMYTAGGA
jgi:hypothetical protein